MSEEKKGFRTEKKPTKAEIQKSQAQELLNQLQLITNVNIQMSQEIRRLNAEITAMANLLRYDADASKIVEAGDNVMLDHYGRFVNEDGSLGDTFDGGFGTGYVVENLGSGVVVPEIENAIMGLHVLDTIELDIIFPETYKNKDMVGKKAHFYLRVCNAWKRAKDDFCILNIRNAHAKQLKEASEVKPTEVINAEVKA